MSSWTRTSKASQRIHKERSQPGVRQKLGFLEKKKDYKLRAIDHEKKQTTIRALRQKALDKNPDEFYFHMINSKIVDGKHIEKPKEEESTDAQKMLMKSQDLAYVRSKRVAETKKIERLKAAVAARYRHHPKTTHTFFVDDRQEKESMKQRWLSRNTLGNADVSKVPLVPKESTVQSASVTAEDPAEPPKPVGLPDLEKILQKEQKKTLKELQQRLHRERELRITEQKLEVRRNLLEKRKPVKLAEGTKDAPAVYKWAFQRSR